MGFSLRFPRQILFVTPLTLDHYIRDIVNLRHFYHRQSSIHRPMGPWYLLENFDNTSRPLETWNQTWLEIGLLLWTWWRNEDAFVIYPDLTKIIDRVWWIFTTSKYRIKNKRQKIYCSVGQFEHVLAPGQTCPSQSDVCMLQGFKTIWVIKTHPL